MLTLYQAKVLGLQQLREQTKPPKRNETLVLLEFNEVSLWIARLKLRGGENFVCQQPGHDSVTELFMYNSIYLFLID